MKNLALIVERDHLSVHEARLMDLVRDTWSVEVFKAAPSDLIDLRDEGWFYRFYLAVETRFMGLFISRLREQHRRVPVSLRPVSGLKDTFSGQGVDLVLNLTRGTLRHDRTPPATRGVLDIHFGNIKTGVEGPPAFWESRTSTAATGWWLTHKEILDSDTAAAAAEPQVVYSGRYKSKRVLSMNVESVFRESHIDLAHELIRLASGAAFRSFDLAPDATWKRPSLLDIAGYRVSTVFRELGFFLKTKARGRLLVFSVGIVDGHWQEADLSSPTMVPNPPGSYLADPFLVKRDGRTVCYVEEFDLASERGRISWLDLGDGSGAPVYRGTLIEEPYHMSFPFPFEHEGELYMIPETFEAGEISLYRCVQFPDQWERCGILMDGVEASDTMIFRDDGQFGRLSQFENEGQFDHESRIEHQGQFAGGGRWRMLTNLRPAGALDFFSRLYVFWSDDPTSSNWTPHPLNPVLVDADGGRNGGLLRGDDGSVFRVGQLQSLMTYGAGWSINHVKSLSESVYMEDRVVNSEPFTRGSTVGGHHMHSLADNTAIDVLNFS